MKPETPSIVDEIAEPSPDMNIKIAAFTVSEKSINTYAVKQAYFESNYSPYYSY